MECVAWPFLAFPAGKICSLAVSFSGNFVAATFFRYSVRAGPSSGDGLGVVRIRLHPSENPIRPIMTPSHVTAFSILPHSPAGG